MRRINDVLYFLGALFTVAGIAMLLVHLINFILRWDRTVLLLPIGLVILGFAFGLDNILTEKRNRKKQIELIMREEGWYDEEDDESGRTANRG